MAYQIDLSHSLVQFSVRHMMLSKAKGEFQKFSGTINLDESNPANTTVDITIDANSINTRDEKRDAHLRSADFFNTEVYPTLHFSSSNVEVTGDSTAKLHGNLTIRDVTKPVVLNVEFVGKSKSPWGTENYGFEAKTKFNRKDWNLEWNVALETGGLLVGEEVSIEIELELVKQ